MTTMLNEELLTPEAAAADPLCGGVSAGTVRRWLHRGVCGVRLEGIRRGGRLMTSQQALQRFFDRLNAETIAAPVAN